MSIATQTMPGSSAAEAPQSIGFLLLPQFSMMAFVAAIEPLRVANRLAERELYRWEVLSDDGRSIAASNGMALVAERAYAEAQGHSLVVVCAGFQPETSYDDRLKRWRSNLARGGVAFRATETGSFLLAWPGLL